jgi:hypothetical protein
LPPAAPWRGVKVCSDPALEARIREVVRLYLDPQGRWWSASNETFQLQVLDRIALMLPMRPGQIER